MDKKVVVPKIQPMTHDQVLAMRRPMDVCPFTPDSDNFFGRLKN